MKSLIYIFRYFSIMYNRKVYRESREFEIEKHCSKLEQKWAIK